MENEKIRFAQELKKLVGRYGIQIEGELTIGETPDQADIYIQWNGDAENPIVTTVKQSI